MKNMQTLAKENLQKGIMKPSRLRGVIEDPGATSTPRTEGALPRINESTIVPEDYEESGIGKGMATALGHRGNNCSDIDFKNEVGSKLAQIKIDIEGAFAEANCKVTNGEPNWLDEFEDKLPRLNQEIDDIEQDCLFRQVVEFHKQVVDLRNFIDKAHTDLKKLFEENFAKSSHYPGTGIASSEVEEISRDYTEDQNDDPTDQEEYDQLIEEGSTDQEPSVKSKITQLDFEVQNLKRDLGTFKDLKTLLLDVKNNYTIIEQANAELQNEVSDLHERMKTQETLLSMLTNQLKRSTPPGPSKPAEASNVNTPRRFDLEMDSVRRSLNRQESVMSPGNHDLASKNAGVTKMYSSRINKYIKGIDNICSDNEITTDIANKTIIDFYNNVLPDLMKLIQDCETALAAYMKAGGNDIGKVNEVELTTTTGQSWIDQVKNLYGSRELHLSSSGKSLAESIPKFKADGKITIYEFLKSVDEHTQNEYTTLEKAKLLVAKLDDKIKMEISTCADDYSKVKAFLIKKYGQVRDIVIAKVSVIKSAKHPGQISSNQMDYYKKVYITLQQIASLHQTSQLPEGKLFEHIYKTDFVMDIIGILPKYVKSKYLESMVKFDKAFSDLEGKEAYDLLLKICKTECSKLELELQLPASDQRYDEKSHPKEKRSSPKKIQTNAIDSTIKPPKQRERSDSVSSRNSQSSNTSKKGDGKVHNASAETRKQRPKEKASKNPPRNVWYDTSLKFPCPIGSHIDNPHEIGTCQEFFAMSAKAKKTDGYQKLCWSCMGPRDKCYPKCSQYKKMPNLLICPECKDDAQSLKKTPFCILMCSNDNHTKPNIEDLLNELAKWFPGFQKSSNMKGSLKHHALLVAVTQACTCGSDKTTCSCSAPASLTREPKDSDPIPCFNTQTGEIVDDIQDCDIINEVVQDSLYIMQMLKFGNEECLTFFDSGSNQHLMNGSLAEDLKLKVICSENMSIGTVGKNRIWTNYGIYSMMLGPDREGGYHEMYVQGISAITDTFYKYNLSTINKEIKRSGILPRETILPEYVGGSEAKLLVGIKDSSISPVLEFTLPNGLGIYRSEFTDMFGSNKCYGGPHQLFTQVNKNGHGSFNFIRCHLSEMVGSYRRSLYSSLRLLFDGTEEVVDERLSLARCKPSKVCHAITDKNDILSPEYESTPLSDQDFKDLEDKVTVNDLEPLNIDFKKFKDCDPEDSQPVDPTVSCLECNIDFVPSNCRSCFKSFIPLSKSKGLIDEEDIDHVVDYRCPTCSKCQECQESNKLKTMSLQEKREQDIIEKSVQVDLDAGKVFVDLPFIEDPIKYLTKRHKGSDNYYQALKAYKSQCKKSEDVKKNIALVQKDLVDRGFMVKLESFPEKTQDLIRKASFRHYYTWKSVEKDSVSTPIRLVVDPTITGLNLILAKGENKLNKIPAIMIRARCKPLMWIADVSKLYNCLHLNDSSLPYSLFLFDESMELDKEPQVWVMTRAWYGVLSSGNQSGFALYDIAVKQQDERPEAVEVVRDDTYVDDTVSGAFTQEEVNTQVNNTRISLSKGGFHFKYVAHSGCPPPEFSSSDGVSLSVLGYKWNPQEDVLGLGFQEVNFNKKIRGVKKKNPFPVITADDVSKLARSSAPITRKTIISKLAEMYDPCGFFEPYKLQLKLDATELNGLDWDKPLNEQLQDYWVERFREFVSLPSLIIPRCVVPKEAVNPREIRLLCLSDAAVSAGGAVIYAGYLLKDGTYSNQMLTAKSKIMKMSIPRNELSALLELAKLTYSVKKALGDLVTDIKYFTDSTIALCWVSNTSKKHRMFVFNRVAEIRRCIEWSVGDISSELPLYHIDGTQNVADLLTKTSTISVGDLGPTSRWQNGDSWMKLPSCLMPVTKYEDLTVSEKDESLVDLECFKDVEVATVTGLENVQTNYSNTGVCDNVRDVDSISKLLEIGSVSDHLLHCSSCNYGADEKIPFLRCYGVITGENHCITCKCNSNQTVFLAKSGGISPERYIVPLIKFGWLKSINVIGKVLSTSHSIIHRVHTKPLAIENLPEKLKQLCLVCKVESLPKKATSTNFFSVHVTTRAKARENQLKIVLHKPTLKDASMKYLFRIATEEVLKELGVKKMKNSFQLDEDGIVVYTGRLSKEEPISTFDLDFHGFYDGYEIKSVVPVVLPSSPIFYSYLMFVHHRLRPHAGVESTLREIMKIMHVPNARPMIARVRKDCPKCRILAKKTVDLHMENHHFSRTTLAPPFYNVQMDIAMSFKAKPFITSRTVLTCHALVIVCLMSGATSIHVMEDLKTHSVVSCLERHSSRYGYPFGVYVDSGTQLAKLVDVEFSLREVNLITYDSMGFEVVVGTPKSHEERGRVEAKVKALKDMLKKLSVTSDTCQTLIGWEISFQKIANQLDNLPIAKTSGSNVYDPNSELITANRLKLGRNNFRSPEKSMLLTNSPSSLLERAQLVHEKWYELFIKQIHHLIPRPKWFSDDKIKVGDICLFLYEDGNQPKLWVWKMGKVIDMNTNRRLVIGYFIPSSNSMRTVQRCPRQVSIIFSTEDLALNTNAHFEKLISENN